jgi:hypothetical protein
MTKDQIRGYRVRVSTIAEKLAASFYFANLFGTKCGTTVDEILAGTYTLHQVLEFPFVGLSYDGCVGGHRLADHCETVTFDEMFRVFNAPSFVSVKLNDTNTANVYADKIVVGCQTFPISIVKDLQTAINKYNK